MACSECNRTQGNVNHARNDLGHLRGQLLRHANDRCGVESLVARVKEAKRDLAAAEEAFAAHQAECATPHQPKPLPPLANVGPVAKKAAPAKSPRKVIDKAAVAAQLARLDDLAKQPHPTFRSGSNTLPATGHCHQCDRRVSGERRFCGPCAAQRDSASRGP